MKKRLYLLQPPEKKKLPLLGYFLEVIDDSFLPLLLAYGVLSLIARSVPLPSDPEAAEATLLLILLILPPLIGLFVPILKVLLDSDIILVDLDGRKLEPVGTKILTYIRSIAGLTALYSFVISVKELLGTFDVAIGSLIIVFAYAYPSIVFVLILYNKFHDSFVEKLNVQLRKELKYIDVTINARRKGTMGTIKLIEEDQVIHPSWYGSQQQQSFPTPPIDEHDEY